MIENLIEFIFTHLIDIILIVVSYILGIATMKIKIRKDNSRTSTKQSGNVVIGGQAGRDIHK
jgi:Na+-transporting NADH:ubiquinone oxidoreductase subunit NqrF